MLFNRTQSCHERGICQRTGPECRKACHLVPAWEGEPPIGYETAPAARVNELRHDLRLVKPATSEKKAEELHDDPSFWEFFALFTLVVAIVTMPFWIPYAEKVGMVGVEFVLAFGEAARTVNY